MTYQRAQSQEEVEQRLRDYIDRLEHWTPTVGQRPSNISEEDHKVREHWLNCGMDEAYDNVIDNLYGILGEER